MTAYSLAFRHPLPNMQFRPVQRRNLLPVSDYPFLNVYKYSLNNIITTTQKCISTIIYIKHYFTALYKLFFIEITEQIATENENHRSENINHILFIGCISDLGSTKKKLFHLPSLLLSLFFSYQNEESCRL